MEATSLSAVTILTKLADMGYTFKAWKTSVGYVVEYRKRYSDHSFEIEDDDMEEAIQRLWSVIEDGR